MKIFYPKIGIQGRAMVVDDNIYGTFLMVYLLSVMYRACDAFYIILQCQSMQAQFG